MNIPRRADAQVLGDRSNWFFNLRDMYVRLDFVHTKVGINL